MKASKERRKFVNQMRQMGDVPWPARRFKYAPTFGGQRVVVGRCNRKVGDTKVRPRRIARKRDVAIVCGGPLVLDRRRSGRRLYCELCRDRRRQSHLHQRLLHATQLRVHSPKQAVAQERRASRLLRRLRVGG